MDKVKYFGCGRVYSTIFKEIQTLFITVDSDHLKIFLVPSNHTSNVFNT